MSTIDRPQSSASAADTVDDRTDGPPAAAVIAAGVGCLAMGAFTTAAEASTSFATTLSYSTAVGPLSGKTIWAVIVWLVAWAVLHFTLRTRNFGITRALAVCLVLTGVGVLLTFPTFFQLFG
jgi:uncharacterized MAPEG superfamily protein